MALKDTILKYSRAQIDAAGKVLLDSGASFEDKKEALEILGNFRSCHAYPINTFQATLRDKLNKTGIEFLVSQRLKRTPSILLKLDRFKSLRLSQMQDIGGLRAILPSMKEVDQIVKLYKEARFQHEIKNEKDYISEPKESGYRCHHVVYKYKNSINPNYDGLMIELQIRTKLQHAWATAVETLGTFLKTPLKSNQGPEEWLEFFAIVGNAFAYIEQTPNMARFAHLSKDEVFGIVAQEAERLQIIPRLEAFRDVIAEVESDKRQGSLHLVVLDVDNGLVRIKTYARDSIEEASADYIMEETEAIDSNRQVVLVSSSSLESLKKAYPSYFLDTEEFIITLKEIIASTFNPDDFI